MRYALRRLGQDQAKVKQLLHVIRRGFVARVREDRVRCREIVNQGSSGSTEPAVQRGLSDSQLQLVHHSAELLGCPLPPPSSQFATSLHDSMIHDLLYMHDRSIETPQTLLTIPSVHTATYPQPLPWLPWQHPSPPTGTRPSKRAVQAACPPHS